jgi:hypothetical protein
MALRTPSDPHASIETSIGHDATASMARKEDEKGLVGDEAQNISEVPTNICLKQDIRSAR